MSKPRIYTMTFAGVYPMYLEKAERKGRTKEEVDRIICWLTGYSAEGLKQQIDGGADMERFFLNAPRMNPAASKITGTICGYRVENIEDKLTQQVRQLDKLIDELAKGKHMDAILRKE